MIQVTCFGGAENPLLSTYIDRLSKLTKFKWHQIPLRKMPSERSPQLLPEELKFLKETSDFVVLDVEGKTYDSPGLAEWLFRGGSRHLVIGPAVGLHPDFRDKAKEKISLSRLTFTHGLAQIVLAEALYRSVCLRENHPFAK
jgi:23S rRNA (pseudouridine1915-N3)-methyltransferase